MSRQPKHRPSFLVKTRDNQKVQHAYKLDRYGSLINDRYNHGEYMETKEKSFNLIPGELRKAMSAAEFDPDVFYGKVAPIKEHHMKAEVVEQKADESMLDEIFKGCDSFDNPFMNGEIFNDSIFSNFY